MDRIASRAAKVVFQRPCLAFALALGLVWCGGATPGFADEPIRLAQDPALSPNGKTLAFVWRGSLWSVPVQGGTATRLTHHPASDSEPAFSPDGKQLAFISDREGSRKVFVMPANGGAAVQRTFHTEGYAIEEWFPAGQSLLVRVTRDHFWRHAERLARFEVAGDSPEQVLLDDYGNDGAVSPDGQRVLFTREGEKWWRKGYTGSRASQIWLLDLAAGECRQVKAADTECRWPLWRRDGKGFYYVGNQGGAFNLWEHDLASGKETRLTRYTDDGVQFPCIARDGRTIVFRQLFDFHRITPGKNAKPQKIDIRYRGDALESPVERVVRSGATEAAFTSDGLQIALVAGGDVWVMDTELRDPRQVTHTPEEERDVAFAPDGKSLWFVSDAGGQVDLWQAERADAKEYWWRNHEFTLTRVTDDEAVEQDLKFSPDGKRLAYVKDLGDLWLADADGANARRVLASWNTPSFDWSPDGQWLAYSLSDEWFNSDVWIMPANGDGQPFNVSRHPDNDYRPAWSPDGKVLAWTGRREAEEVDIYYVWLRAQDDEQGKYDRTLEKALEKMRKASASRPAGAAVTNAPVATPKDEANDQAPDKEKPDATARENDQQPVVKSVTIDFEGLPERIRRIANPSITESSLVWSPDSKKLAFAATVEEKRNTYTLEFPDDLKPRLLAPVAGSHARWLKQGDQIVWLTEGVPGSLSAKGVATTFKFTARQSVATADRHRAVFDQCWRTMRDRFYDERLGNRDWPAVRAKYAAMAAQAPDLRTLADVVHLMLGELNASHLGFSYSNRASTRPAWREETAHLGLRFDPAHAGPGWKVRDVLTQGPASHQHSRVAPGEIVLRVDGRDVTPATDPVRVLNGVPERDILLRVRNAAGAERDVRLRPISYGRARQLLYRQWLDDCRRRVDRLSDGRLGYLHISAMNESSFYKFEEDLFAAGDGRDGLVIDVRENGGGSTTDHLLTALTQPRHAITVPRGGTPGYPQDRKVYASWHKPVVVLCNQNSFSNAEIFSHAIKTLERGQLVGVPTAGAVISTGSTRIMDVGTLRLPFRGWYLLESGEDMELHGAVPHHIVWPHPGDLPAGKDTQLEKAVAMLLAGVAQWQQQPQPKLLKATERGAP